MQGQSSSQSDFKPPLSSIKFSRLFFFHKLCHQVFVVSSSIFSVGDDGNPPLCGISQAQLASLTLTKDWKFLGKALLLLAIPYFMCMHIRVLCFTTTF